MNTPTGGWMIAAVAAAFVVDLLTPLGYAVPMLYVLPILLTWMLPSRQSTVLVVGSVLLLTWIGVPLSPGELTPEVLTNRAMGSVLLLAIGWLLLIHKESAQKMIAVQQARDESEERFAKAFRTSPHPIGITEVATGCCVEVNDACLQLFGFRREEVIGHTTLMLGIWPNPEDRSRLIERLKAGEPVRNLELIFRTKSGDLRHILVSSDLVELSGTQCLITVGNDITARKRAEDTLRQLNETLEQHVVERTAALRETEERFRNLFEHAAEGIAITELEGRFVQCNAAYAAMVGYNEQELRGLQFESLLHPDDRLHNMELVRQLLSGDVPSFEVENRYLMKSGRSAWVHTHASILRNDQGIPTHLMALVTDVTKRKQMEDELRRSEAFTGSVVDNLPLMVFVKDAEDLRFRRLNKAGEQLLGYSEREMRGKNDYDFFPKEEADFFTAKDQEVLASGRLVVIPEEWIKTRDGTLRLLHTKKIPIGDHNGHPQYLLGISEDITERKRAEEELGRQHTKLEAMTAELLTAQETERRRLACELHDDITQRIATVAIDLQSIRSVIPGSEASLVAHVHRAGKMAEQVTTDLQRLAHQLHPSLLEHVGLEAAVQEQVEEFETRTGVKTKVQVHNLPTALSLDRSTCLYRVLQESLQNVRKHANATYVVVRLLGSKQGVGLCVHDDGCGFDQDHQTSNGRKGLGLISMEERVGALKGTFRIKTKPGDGTEIHAWVPLEDVKREA